MKGKPTVARKNDCSRNGPGGEASYGYTKKDERHEGAHIKKLDRLGNVERKGGHHFEVSHSRETPKTVLIRERKILLTLSEGNNRGMDNLS